jgi:hypothetical protein
MARVDLRPVTPRLPQVSNYTSFADATSLSIVFLVFSAIFYACGFAACIYAVGAFFLIMLTSICGSFSVTRKHIAIDQEQLEIIRFKYSDSVRKGLAALDH